MWCSKSLVGIQPRLHLFRDAVWRRGAAVVALAGLGLLGACGDDDLTGNIDPDLREGADRIWEVSAPGLPSGFDFVSGQRLFLGSGDVSSTVGDVFVDGAPGSTDLHLRAISSLVRAFATNRVGLRDLGVVEFEGLDEVPEDGYTDPDDSTGVAIVQGHVYALAVERATLAPSFAKLVVDSIGGVPGEPDAQFVDFRYVLQIQPGNPRFEED